jgi:putative FmdB family regulatory protein
MPLYEYRCEQCGPFDHRRDTDQASAPLDCPLCAAPARRVYTAPGIRTRKGPLAGAGRADRARADRALTGEPVVTGPPQGRRLPFSGHPH